MVAAFAKEHSLASVVGTQTGGQVLGGANFSVGRGFVLRFPAAGWYSWRGDIVVKAAASPLMCTCRCQSINFAGETTTNSKQR